MGCTALYAALAEAWTCRSRTSPRRPARSACSTSSCNAFCEPGDEVVYAWRSFEAYPIVVAVRRRDGRAGAAHRRRSPRPRRDGRRDHRPDPGGRRLHPEQPDRARRRRRPTSTRFLARVPPHVVVVLDEAYREFVGATTPVDGIATYRRHDNVVRDCARSRRPTGSPACGSATPSRPRRWPRRSARCRCRSGSSASPRPPPSPRWRRIDELLERVEALVGARAELRRPAPRGRAGPCPTRRATSCGSRSASAPRSSPRRAARRASRCAPSPATGVRVSIGESEAFDRVVEVAARFAP